MGSDEHNGGPVDLGTIRAALGGQVPAEPLVIDLKMSGGVESQRYRLDLSVTGDGRVTCHLLDQLKDRDAEAEAQLEAVELSPIHKRLLATGVLDADIASSIFPPDTVIGLLSLKYGGTPGFRTRFSPEPEKVPGYQLVPAIDAAVEVLLEVGARVLQMEAIGP